MTTSTARRQQLYRERLKRDLRCVQVEIRRCEVQELVRRGFLAAPLTNDTAAIRKAIYAFLDENLADRA